MNKFAKLAAVAAATLAATPALAVPVSPGSEPQARARIIKPLTLSAVGTLNFGTIVLNNVTANQTITLSPGNVLSCGDSVQTVCSDPTSVPTYTVTGTQGQVVDVTSTASDLVNQNDATTLSMTPSDIADITLSNSGGAGDDFTVGGSFVITPTTTDGVYLGTVDVEVDYN